MQGVAEIFSEIAGSFRRKYDIERLELEGITLVNRCGVSDYFPETIEPKALF
jgi:hypothetical protein